MILWEVKIEWASNGKLGEGTWIVAATTAVGAVQEAWKTEDHNQIRAVFVRWLVPLDGVAGIKIEEFSKT